MGQRKITRGRFAIVQCGLQGNPPKERGGCGPLQAGLVPEAWSLGLVSPEACSLRPVSET